MRKTLMMAAAGAVAMTGNAAWAAPSNGDAVTCASNVFDCSSASAVVGPGPEFTLDEGSSVFPDGPQLSADFSSGTLTIANIYDNSVGFSGGRLVFSDTTTPFTQAVLTSYSGVLNFDQSNISLTNGTLRLFFGQTIGNTTFESYFSQPGASLTIRLGALAAATPEPGTWAMMIIGFGVAGFALRRRQRVTARLAYA